MPQRRIITHAYRLPGGWQKHAHQLLTPKTVEELRDLGFTLLRTRRRWHRPSELSIAQYLRSHRQ